MSQSSNPVVRPNLPRAKPPEVNRLDHLIHLQHGSTSVLEFSPQRIQHAKQDPAPNLSTRVAELTKELGRMRHEIQFYRECFENLQRLRETCYDVYQQLYLANYLDHNFERLHELIVQLHRGLEGSVRREVDAEKAWMDFWGITFQTKEFEGEMI